MPLPVKELWCGGVSVLHVIGRCCADRMLGVDGISLLGGVSCSCLTVEDALNVLIRLSDRRWLCRGFIFMRPVSTTLLWTSRLWRLRQYGRVKSLSHMLQAYGRSKLCFSRICCSTLWRHANISLQSSHVQGCSFFLEVRPLFVSIRLRVGAMVLRLKY